MSEQWPADRVERRAVTELEPYAKNSRRHSRAQVDMLAASIRQWGWTIPVLIDEVGGIIAGHGRVLAAKQLGIETVPVMVAEGWSPDQKRAYVIADNRLAETAEWDSSILADELNELMQLDFDMEPMGIDDDFIESMFGKGGAFAPNLNPGAGGRAVTGEDMGKAQAGLDGRFAAPQQLVDVTCPHCGEDFGIDPSWVRQNA